jgi:hypothetical protein
MGKYLVIAGWILAALVPPGTAHALGKEVLIAPCGGERDVHFTMIVPGADVPEQYRAFSGIWLGQWSHFPFVGGGMKTSSPYCTGLIVTKVNPDGGVVLVCFYGRNAELGIMEPVAYSMRGKIIGNTLNTRDQYKHGMQFTIAGTDQKTGQPEMKAVGQMVNEGKLIKIPYQPPARATP